MTDSAIRSAVASPVVASTEADGVLLATFVAGDSTTRERAFQALVERHMRMVVATCRRVGARDSEDAAQAAFLVLAMKAAALRDHPCLAAWLHQTAVRIGLRRRDAEHARRRHEAAVPTSTRAAEGPSQCDLREEIDAALAALPERCRAALMLHYLEGHSQSEAAERLGMGVGTFTKLLTRGRERLRQALGRRGVRAASAAVAAALIDAGADAADLALPAGMAAQVARAGAAPSLAAAGVSPDVVALARLSVSPPRTLRAAAALSATLFVGTVMVAMHARAPSQLDAQAVASVLKDVRPTPAKPDTPPIPSLSERARTMFETCPQPVRTTIAREAAGRTVLELERVRHTARFEVEFGPPTRETLVIDDDGGVESREPDHDDER